MGVEGAARAHAHDARVDGCIRKGFIGPWASVGSPREGAGWSEEVTGLSGGQPLAAAGSGQLGGVGRLPAAAGLAHRLARAAPGARGAVAAAEAVGAAAHRGGRGWGDGASGARWKWLGAQLRSAAAGQRHASRSMVTNRACSTGEKRCSGRAAIRSSHHSWLSLRLTVTLLPSLSLYSSTRRTLLHFSPLPWKQLHQEAAGGRRWAGQQAAPSPPADPTRATGPQQSTRPAALHGMDRSSMATRACHAGGRTCRRCLGTASSRRRPARVAPRTCMWRLQQRQRGMCRPSVSCMVLCLWDMDSQGR